MLKVNQAAYKSQKFKLTHYGLVMPYTDYTISRALSKRSASYPDINELNNTSVIVALM